MKDNPRVGKRVRLLYCADTRIEALRDKIREELILAPAAAIEETQS